MQVLRRSDGTESATCCMLHNGWGSIVICRSVGKDQQGDWNAIYILECNVLLPVNAVECSFGSKEQYEW